MAVSEAGAMPRAASEDEAAAQYLLHDEATLAQIAQDAVAFAERIGAGRAVAFVRESGGISVKTAEREIVSAERNGTQSLSVTIVDGGRTGQATTGVFSSEAIRAVVERAACIAAQVEPDPDGELADPAILAYDTDDVPLYAPSGMDAMALANVAHEIEFAAHDAIARQANSARVLETNVSSDDQRWAHAIAPDFCRTGSASMQHRWTQVIAERDRRMASGHWASSDRRTAAMLPSTAIGATAVERATRKLGGRSLDTRDCPVLFDATVASSLIGEVVRALSGGPQYQKSTLEMIAAGVFSGVAKLWSATDRSVLSQHGVGSA